MPRKPLPEPDRDTDPEGWEAWRERRLKNEAARDRRAARRDRLDDPADGTPMVAEARCEGTFFRPSPHPPLVLRVAVRLRVPQSFIPQDRSTAYYGQNMVEALPLPWKVRNYLWGWLKSGISGGISVISHPWPKGGLDIEFTQMEVVPPLEPDASAEEIGRFSETLHSIMLGAVAAAYGGLVASYTKARYVDTPILGTQWFIMPANEHGASQTGGAFPTREAAEAAMTRADRAAGYRVVGARDSVSLSAVTRGEPEPPELRYGEYTLTPEEAANVTPDEWVFHLGMGRLQKVRAVRLDGPGAPLINAGRGWEPYTFFRLPEDGDTA